MKKARRRGQPPYVFTGGGLGTQRKDSRERIAFQALRGASFRVEGPAGGRRDGGVGEGHITA